MRFPCCVPSAVQLPEPLQVCPLEAWDPLSRWPDLERYKPQAICSWVGCARRNDLEDKIGRLKFDGWKKLTEKVETQKIIEEFEVFVGIWRLFFSNLPANKTLCKLAMLAPWFNNWFVYSNQATTSPSGKSSKAKTPNPLSPLFTEIFSKPFAPNPSSHSSIRHASRPPRGTRVTRSPWHHVAHSTRPGTNAARCRVA